MLKYRVISGIIFAAIAIFSFMYNETTTFLFITLLAVIALYEIIKMYRSMTKSLKRILLLSLYVLICAFIYIVAVYYISVEVVLLAIPVVMAILFDTFAYLFGRKFGKHKMLKKVSPNKTWEGAILSFIITPIIFAFFYLNFYEQILNFNFLEYIMFVAVLCTFAQVGDLVVSLIKRVCKIKDTGRILKGHGGVMDRLDSVIATILGSLIMYNILGVI